MILYLILTAIASTIIARPLSIMVAAFTKNPMENYTTIHFIIWVVIMLVLNT